MYPLSRISAIPGLSIFPFPPQPSSIPSRPTTGGQFDVRTSEFLASLRLPAGVHLLEAKDAGLAKVSCVVLLAPTNSRVGTKASVHGFAPEHMSNCDRIIVLDRRFN